MRAIETRYTTQQFEHYSRHRLKDATAVAKTMTLREIFVVMARTGRAQARESAA
jgi:hypothetical protein